MLWYHLVRRSVVLLLMASPGNMRPIRHRRQQVANDSPGSLPGCGDVHIIVLSRARRVKTVNLDAVFARAAYKRPSATLLGNYQLGSLTTGSPAGHLSRVCRFEGEHSTCSSLAPLAETSPRGGRRLPHLLARYGGSMYSLACRTPGIIPREYCSLRDRGA